MTPGPLSTPDAVRRAMDRDWGSRDPEFVALSERVRGQLAAMLGAPDLTAILLQGSGTFSVEAMLGTFVPQDGKALVLVNGAYGRRMQQILAQAGRPHAVLERSESTPIRGADVDEALAADQAITHVAAVHCETTTGLLNPIEDIANTVERRGRALLVDAMSAFGALPFEGRCDALAASANKCLEGVPGVGFVIARRAALEGCGGRAHSLSLDLHDQWQRFERDGQWRFTPPTHVLAALDAALELHAAEGGVAGRGARYAANHRVLVEGMGALGFQTLLPPDLQAPIIVTFLEPRDPAYRFEAFYDALHRRGFAIYPGKLTRAETFRVGCIGRVTPEDMQSFLQAVREALAELGMESGRP